MPIQREPIFHDRQAVCDSNEQTTSSTSYDDVTGAILTAKDLGEPANYNFSFSVVLSSSLNNTTANFIILVNDVEISCSERDLMLKVKDFDIGYTFLGNIPGVNAGDEIKVQWKTDQGTLILSGFNLRVDGIPRSRLI